MRAALMQPTFLPWCGFFELISKADVFVFLDDFQFVYRSYHQRNRLFLSKDKIGWYGVPVDKQSGYLKELCDIRVKNDTNWREKMWKRIEYNYRKAPYFSLVSDAIRDKIVEFPDSLLEGNLAIIKTICMMMGIKKQFMYSSNMEITTKKSQAILDILHNIGADTYLCANGSFGYMYEEKKFPQADIEVLFQNHVPVLYEQINCYDGAFFPYLSILDATFNIGPDATRCVVDGGTHKWITWNEMVRGDSNG